MKVKISCSVLLTLCDPMDSSPPGPSVQGILQARILEWVAREVSEVPGNRMVDPSKGSGFYSKSGRKH